MSQLVIVAQVNGFTGYGVNAINTALGLLARGHEVFLRSTARRSWEIPSAIFERCISAPADATDWELSIHHPSWIPTPGKKTVYCTTFETAGIQSFMLNPLEMAEAVIVPSTWNKSCLLEAGLKAPLFSCPESIDTSVFHYIPKQESKLVIFGAGGSMANGDTRKRIQRTVDCFLRAFECDPGVRLTVKLPPGQSVNCHDDRRIDLVSANLTPIKLAEWYSGLDLFISISAGEAWGRMTHEALSIGRPIITPRYGGPVDYIPVSACYLIPHFEVPAEYPYEGIGRWCDMEDDDIIDVMRVARRDGARSAKGIVCASTVSHLSISNRARKLEQILSEVGAIQVARESDEDHVRKFYADKSPTPKLPLPDLADRNLTNTPTGLGDTVILTGIPSAAASAGRATTIKSKSPFFRELAALCPGYSIEGGNKWIAADVIQRTYACGGGHIIQRLHKALGLPAPEIPRGVIDVGRRVQANRVALHFTPGAHSNWQDRYVRQGARQLRPEGADILRAFMRSKPWMEFIEIGSEPSGLFPEAIDGTRVSLSETIKLLSTCDYFIGIMSGPMHLATAIGVRCIVIIDFPYARELVLPAIIDVPIVDSEWAYPQNVHLHQFDSSRLVPRLSLSTLEMAVSGEIYPYFGEQHEIHPK